MFMLLLDAMILAFGRGSLAGALGVVTDVVAVFVVVAVSITIVLLLVVLLVSAKDGLAITSRGFAGIEGAFPRRHRLPQHRPLGPLPALHGRLRGVPGGAPPADPRGAGLADRRGSLHERAEDPPPFLRPDPRP